MNCGYDFGEDRTESYPASHRFTGPIKQVTIDASSDPIRGGAAGLRRIMSKQ
jgi:hypothetical protein